MMKKFEALDSLLDVIATGTKDVEAEVSSLAAAKEISGDITIGLVKAARVGYATEALRLLKEYAMNHEKFMEKLVKFYEGYPIEKLPLHIFEFAAVVKKPNKVVSMRQDILARIRNTIDVVELGGMFHLKSWQNYEAENGPEYAAYSLTSIFEFPLSANFTSSGESLNGDVLFQEVSTPFGEDTRLECQVRIIPLNEIDEKVLETFSIRGVSTNWIKENVKVAFFVTVNDNNGYFAFVTKDNRLTLYI